jgi:hypothetical protein
VNVTFVKLVWQVRQRIPWCGPEVIWKQPAWASSRAGQNLQVLWQVWQSSENPAVRVVDRREARAIVVGAVARHAPDRRAGEGPVAHVAVTLLARDERVLSDQGKCRAPVSVGVEERPPALGVVAPLAVRAELAAMAIAVTAGAGVGDGDVESAWMTASTRDAMCAPQREARRVVVEADLAPALDPVAGGAASDVAACTQERLHQRRVVRSPLRSCSPVACDDLGTSSPAVARAGKRSRGQEPQVRRRAQVVRGAVIAHGSNPRKAPW